MTEPLPAAGAADDGGAGRPGRRALVAFLRGPFTVRTWREFGYLLLSGPLGLAGLVYLVGGLSLGLGLAITFVGLPLLAGVVVGGRVWGALYRWLPAVVLCSAVPAPRPFRARRSVTGWLRDALADRSGWRACAFVALKVPLSVVQTYGPVLLWCEAWFLVFSPVPWWLAHPTNVDRHGVVHHSLFQWGEFFVDSWRAR